VTGLVTGGVGGLLSTSAAASAFNSIGTKAAIKAGARLGLEATARIAIKAAASVLASEVTTLMTNWAHGEDLANGLGKAAVLGAASGAGGAIASEAGGLFYMSQKGYLNALWEADFGAKITEISSWFPTANTSTVGMARL